MNELIQQIAQKTGLSQDKVQQVVTMVVDHVKGKLPESLSSQLDGLLAGGSAAGGDLKSTIMSGLGNMLGRNS